ncbi:MAG: helix-turn-helix transcriptional regulator [Clostridia bacterium]|nr:helix-turn-helix transcriptional regulator [Clostridia bacterium]
MNHEYELNFFRDILEKCHIHTSVLSIHDNMGATVEQGFGKAIESIMRLDMTVQKLLGNIESKTKYMLCNELGLQYVCLRLPATSERNILFVGPYLASFPSSKEILEIGEKMGLSPSVQRLLKEYYATLPVLSGNDRIFGVIDAFCERIWQTSSFSIVEADKSYALPLVTMNGASRGESAEEILASVRVMEMRYSFENEMIRAVTLGQQHKEELLAAAFNENMFEKRVQDPLRNAKNYCIIMNTLLRKAAENGGVHPIHIDRLSSKFALKIELMSSVKAVPEFMRKMFASYCSLVQKHATKHYSPLVKRTVIMIDSDISAELSLGTLAEKQGVSEGYLATVFKKEIGTTVSEYVRNKRIEYAKYLLSTTHLQIQTVALHCGIMDVQYFSKIFKKQIGKTPREYREAIRARA